LSEIFIGKGSLDDGSINLRKEGSRCGGEAWHGMAFRFSLFIFKDFLGSDSILGEYPVADSLFIENKIPKKEIKCSWPKVMTIRLYNKKGCVRGGEKEKKSP